MQDADTGKTKELDGEGLHIGIVRARFNDAVTRKLEEACVAELGVLGVATKFDALVALGCVIRGETYHFELVANESGAGVTRVALDHLVPIANAILTVDNEAQAWARAEDKGRDAARVAVEMANLLEDL
jgi:6,7-dimethyl-8-ribityllumazine synthase